MPQASFDLVVIGSGPSGQKAALNSAKLGKRVALIDRKELVGGVCIHTGTIPSKAIREAVLHLTAFNERSVYGNSYAVKHDITMGDLLYRCRHVVKTEVDVIRSDTAKEDLEIHGDNILVAVGTEPARPKNVPFAPSKVIDSNGLLLLQ